MNKRLFKLIQTALLVFTTFSAATAKPADSLKMKASVDTLLAACDVQWNSPGPTSAQSMPLGNGDIGLNVWAEKNGDLVFYISKTDAWGGELSSQKDEWMKREEYS